MAKKIDFKNMLMTGLSSTAGAFGGNKIDNLVEDKIEESGKEVGAKLALFALGCYASTKTKGAIRDGVVAATGAIGSGTIESIQRMMEEDKPTKGVDEELQGIYDEIKEAMNGANDVNVTGANDPTVAGANSPVVTGADYGEE